MPAQFQAYWNENIDKWGEKYLDISHGHETFGRPRMVYRTLQDDCRQI